ncbi:MAG: Holliday junction branch migration protein RuvA [Bacteroidales bacterium]|jgi:Holliday junction DNA helicase RuvA|nr:Holliday junction branch migration protein RuvA [Bacteroidales bacterium]
MYDYIKGNISEISPTEVIVECCGIGYSIMISLQTYDILKDCSEAKIFIYHYIREDDEQFYGFATKDERELFKLLISVSGVGVASARMMLSSLSDEEIRNAIMGEDVAKIKSIKGIGLKTAQRLILDLKDKIIKGGGVDKANLTIQESNNNIDEATAALLNLGFTKANISKILPSILKSEPQASIETIIREALKRL